MSTPFQPAVYQGDETPRLFTVGVDSKQYISHPSFLPAREDVLRGTHIHSVSVNNFSHGTTLYSQSCVCVLTRIFSTVLHTRFQNGGSTKNVLIASGEDMKICSVQRQARYKTVCSYIGQILCSSNGSGMYNRSCCSTHTGGGGGKYGVLGAFRKIAESGYSFVMSFRLSARPPAWNKSAPTERIFNKFDI